MVTEGQRIIVLKEKRFLETWSGSLLDIKCISPDCAFFSSLSVYGFFF